MSGQVACGTMSGVGFLVAGIFAALSALHLYWALGGTACVAAAIPEVPSTRGDRAHNGRASDGSASDDHRRGGLGSAGELVRAFHPSATLTLFMAIALAMVAVLASLRAGTFVPWRDPWWLRSTLGAIALILVARAVGDRNLVGFFKRIRGTRFAVRDTWLYSPLCVLLALGLGWLVLGAPCGR